MSYYINDRCVNCRMCLTDCPADAIYYGIDRYEINADCCISCGRCAEVCGQGAVVSTEQPEQTAIPHDPIQKNCDVLVIGGGGSGLVAAARAAAQHPELNIILIEKKPKLGGCAWNAIGINISGSRMQKAAGISFDLEQKIKDAMEETKYQLDEQLVRNMFSASGPFFDWLCTFGDVEENFRVNSGPSRFGVGGVEFFRRKPDENRGAGRFIMEKMQTICQFHNVEILTNCRAEGVETEKGMVTTIIAEDESGKLLIHPKTVILCAGSWISNPDILRNYVPKFADVKHFRSAHAPTGNTGDGIALGEQMGAFIDYDSFCARFGGPCPPVFEANVGAFIGKAECMNVNALGRRWGNEEPFILPGMDPESVGDPPVLSQPGAFTWCVMDSNILKCIAEENLSQSGGEGFDRLGPDYLDKLDRQADLGSNIIKRADSIEELAQKIEVDPQILKQEVMRYNHLCAQGVDLDFGKASEYMHPITEAPFYATLGATMSDGAFGGVLVDPEMRVYNKERLPMENVFAAGDMTSGRFINDNGQKRQIINDLTWAVLSGFMAGENAAELVAHA